MDLAAFDGEIHGVIGDERTETLGDRFQLDGKGHRGSGLWSDGIVLPSLSNWKRTGAAPNTISYFTVSTVILPEMMSAFAASTLAFTSSGILAATSGQ